MKLKSMYLTVSATLAIAVGIFTFIGGTQIMAQTSNKILEDTTDQRPWYELGMMADPILDQTRLFYLSITLGASKS